MTDWVSSNSAYSISMSWNKHCLRLQTHSTYTHNIGPTIHTNQIYYITETLEKTQSSVCDTCYTCLWKPRQPAKEPTGSQKGSQGVFQCSFPDLRVRKLRVPLCTDAAPLALLSWWCISLRNQLRSDLSFPSHYTTVCTATQSQSKLLSFTW